MSDTREFSSAARNDAASVAWFISFGDLLTLLVCFFLVLTPWHMTREGDKNVTKQGVVNSSAIPQGAGTWLAYRPLGHISRLAAEVPLLEEDFQATRAEGGRSTLDGIRAELLAHAAHTRAVELTVCEASRYPELFERLGALRREMFVGREGVRVVMRATCDNFEVLRPVTGRVIGRVRIVRE